MARRAFGPFARRMARSCTAAWRKSLRSLRRISLSPPPHDPAGSTMYRSDPHLLVISVCTASMRDLTKPGRAQILDQHCKGCLACPSEGNGPRASRVANTPTSCTSTITGKGARFTLSDGMAQVKSTSGRNQIGGLSKFQAAIQSALFCQTAPGDQIVLTSHAPSIWTAARNYSAAGSDYRCQIIVGAQGRWSGICNRIFSPSVSVPSRSTHAVTPRRPFAAVLNAAP